MRRSDRFREGKAHHATAVELSPLVHRTGSVSTLAEEGELTNGKNTRMTDIELWKTERILSDRQAEITKELHPRRLIAEYGAENPELTAYRVDISVWVPLMVLARDAERIATQVWITDARFNQIDYDDDVAVTIEKIELNEVEDA
jgi:hypothetical protein